MQIPSSGIGHCYHEHVIVIVIRIVVIVVVVIVIVVVIRVNDVDDALDGDPDEGHVVQDGRPRIPALPTQPRRKYVKIILGTLGQSLRNQGRPEIVASFGAPPATTTTTEQY